MGQRMLGRRLAKHAGWVEPISKKVQPVVRRALGRAMPVRNALDGRWLGMPLHPVLTDFPLGAVSTAVALDAAEVVCRSRSLGKAADRALAVGVLSTVPAAVTGASDYRDLRGETRRVATVHALLNVAGLGLNACSLGARFCGHRRVARTTLLAGSIVSATAAHVGGELSFGMGVRVNHDAWYAGPAEFTEVLDDSALSGSGLKRVDVAGTPVVLARSETGSPCAIGAVCNHAGGPLDEGERRGESVTCPWHGSRFDLQDGTVLDGPAVFDQPQYETRVHNGRIAIREVRADR